jgi:hypothetical protein
MLYQTGSAQQQQQQQQHQQRVASEGVSQVRIERFDGDTCLIDLISFLAESVGHWLDAIYLFRPFHSTTKS